MSKRSIRFSIDAEDGKRGTPVKVEFSWLFEEHPDKAETTTWIVPDLQEALYVVQRKVNHLVEASEAGHSHSLHTEAVAIDLSDLLTDLLPQIDKLVRPTAKREEVKN